ncbi:MAG: hypothetical protein N2662_00110 [Bacteroidales bacterium]|nr:hypothetical protein [Bacteroidales bacterium]
MIKALPPTDRQTRRTTPCIRAWRKVEQIFWLVDIVRFEVFYRHAVYTGSVGNNGKKTKTHTI